MATSRSRRSSRSFFGRCRRVLAEQLAQRLVAAMRADLHRTDGGSRDLGGLGDGLAVELREDDGFTLLLGQLGERVERGFDELGIRAWLVAAVGGLARDVGG